MTSNEELAGVPVRNLRTPAPTPYVAEQPVTTFPRLGHGIRWSDIVAEMRADQEAGQADRAA